MPEVRETAMACCCCAQSLLRILKAAVCGNLLLSQVRVQTRYLVFHAISVEHAGKPAGVYWIWEPVLAEETRKADKTACSLEPEHRMRPNLACRLQITHSTRR